MPRRPPSRVRREQPYRRTRVIRLGALPGEVVGALDRLGDDELRPGRIATALWLWRRHSRQPRRELGNASSDETESMAPDARDDLEHAVQALPPRPARTLRRLLAPLDRVIAAKTLAEPYSDPSLPWWRRRYTELYRGQPRTQVPS